MGHGSDKPGEGAGSTGSLRKPDSSDLYSGIFFMGIALLGLFASRDYHVGSATNMGEGYIPRLICWILLGLGGVIFARAFSNVTHADIEPLKWRPIVFVPAAIVTFGLTVEALGLVLAIPLLILVGSLAGRELRIMEVFMTALVLGIGTIAAFSWGLGLQIPVLPRF